MSPLSSTGKAAVNAPETAVAFLTLLEIDHAELAAPIRVVNNQTDVTSGGHVFSACAFQGPFPDDSAEKPPQVTLTICNVDRTITIALAEIASPPTVRLWLVTSTAPDTIEVGPLEFTLLSVDYDVLTIRAMLGYEPILNEPFPKGSFTPHLFPGLF